MAATSIPDATLAAIDMLRSGGNAMDAALTAAAVLAVAEPHSTGIGGDVFCMYAPAGSSSVFAMNGSGRSSAAAEIETVLRRGESFIDPVGPDAVTIPGAVSAWEALSKRFGRRGLDEILQPAIGFAEGGYVVQPCVSDQWQRNVNKLQSAGVQAFLPGGSWPKAGDRMTNPALGRTLRAIASLGAKAFYDGAVAADLVQTLRSRGGVQTEDDFAEAAAVAEFVDPLRLSWNDYEVWEPPPNGSGLIALMILGILDDQLSRYPALGAARFHRHVEAARLAYRDRDAFLADPNFANVPVDRLLSPAYLTQLRDLINDTRALTELPQPGETRLPTHRDTVYLCVVDEDGNACSFINSLFEAFGSGIYADKSGVLLHNRGASFVLEPHHPNALAPRKRPMHTIIPGMLTHNGSAVMPFGVMGGHFQPMGQTLFLENMFKYGLDIQASLDFPRLMPRLGDLQVEGGIPSTVQAALLALGHRLVEVATPLGGGQAIWIDRERGVFIGGSDPRLDGMALGC